MTKVYGVITLRGLDGEPFYVLAGKGADLDRVSKAADKALAGDADALVELEGLITTVAGLRRPKSAAEEAAACVAHIKTQLKLTTH
jgi:hypothetical protein